MARHSIKSAVISLIALASVLSSASVSAQDRVLIQQTGGSRFPMSGYVEDYTGREISLRLKPDEAVRRYARADIIEVTTEYTPHHDRGRKLFVSGKIAEAREEFASALNDEDRPWVRREILASQVKCALWNGDYYGAVSRFIPIVHSDAETFHFGLVPLNWTDDQPATNLRFDSRGWIGPTATPLSRLIGASWLLSVTDAAMEAGNVLKKLAREPDVRIQRLAQMQLWRIKLKGESQIDPDEIAGWEKFIEGLPVELRGGSYFVIGQAWKQRHEHEKAARAFLWLPLVYDADRWLSSRACFEAAESLSEAGDLTEAIKLYSEVVFRYGDTPWGTKAESAWTALRLPTSVKTELRE
jgi:tetratricopeptide (TPR) repeat protein